MKAKLPKQIYVKRETDQADKESTWLTADETMDSLENGETIGVYQLVEIKTMLVTKTLK